MLAITLAISAAIAVIAVICPELIAHRVATKDGQTIAQSTMTMFSPWFHHPFWIQLVTAGVTVNARPSSDEGWSKNKAEPAPAASIPKVGVRTPCNTKKDSLLLGSSLAKIVCSVFRSSVCGHGEEIAELGPQFPLGSVYRLRVVVEDDHLLPVLPKLIDCHISSNTIRREP